MVKLITIGVVIIYLLVSRMAVGAQDDTDRRILDLDRMRRLESVELRLSAIEAIEIKARLEQLERIGNGLLLVVFGQLVLNGLSLKRR